MMERPRPRSAIRSGIDLSDRPSMERGTMSALLLAPPAVLTLGDRVKAHEVIDRAHESHRIRPKATARPKDGRGPELSHTLNARHGRVAQRVAWESEFPASPNRTHR